MNPPRLVLFPFAAFMAGLACAPGGAVSISEGECRLCEPVQNTKERAVAAERPVTIEITTRLNFSRIALSGEKNGGEAEVAPNASPIKLRGGLVDLGGYSLAGTAIVNGEPGRQIRIDMPSAIKMTSASGGHIELSALQTNLGPTPRLDASGTLQFSFGGALAVNGKVSGKFRGRIPITVQYE